MHNFNLFEKSNGCKLVFFTAGGVNTGFAKGLMAGQKASAELHETLSKPTLEGYKKLITKEGPLAALKYYKYFSKVKTDDLKEVSVQGLLLRSVEEIQGKDVPQALQYLQGLKAIIKLDYRIQMVGNLLYRSNDSIKYKAPHPLSEGYKEKVAALKNLKIKLLRRLAGSGGKSPFMLMMDSSFSKNGVFSFLCYGEEKGRGSDVVITPKEFAQALRIRYRKFPQDKTKTKPTIFVRSNGGFGTRFLKQLKVEMGKLPMPEIYVFQKD